MSENDWELLRERRGCFGMEVAGLATPTIPTTPITASVIAAIQCQEMVKLLHGAPSLAGSGMVFNGGVNDVYTFRINRNEDCNSHETFERIVPLGRAASGVSAAELLSMAAADLGEGAAVNFHRPLLVSLKCPGCDSVQGVFRPVGSLKDDMAICPTCRTLRQAETCVSVRGGEAFLDRPFSGLGVPPFDIIAASKGGRMIGYQFSGDAPAVLGPVWSSGAATAAGVA
jgi:adenylyltransferase/sulfurtransferase